MLTRREFTASGALAALLFATTGARAGHKRLAFVVGNNEYENLVTLKTAASDAEVIGKALQTIGFDVTVQRDLSRRAFVKAFSDFEARLSAGDVAFLFYAGHGVEIDGANYLLPIDLPKIRPGNVEMVKDEAITTDRLVQRVKAAGASVEIVVLDACRTNPFRDTNGRSVPGTRGLRTTESAEGVFMIYSAGMNEEALDSLSDDDPVPNSVFTRAFVPLIQQADKNLVDVAKDARLRVKTMAASIGHKQSPSYYDDVDGYLYLARSGEIVVARPINPPVPSGYSLADVTGKGPGEFIFPDSDKRLIRRAELSRLSPAKLRIAKNEIYARRGRYFHSPSLAGYFHRFAWYKPTSWDAALLPIELQNVSLIQEVEATGMTA